MTGALALLVLSCSSSSETSPPADTEFASTTSVGGEFGDLDLQRFEVDGAEVWTRSALPTLPSNASQIQLTTVFSNAGNGVTACLGLVLSTSPRCGGPIVDNLDLGSWANQADGVTWGHRRVSVTWPPENRRVRAVADFPADLPTSPPAIDEVNPFVLPESCKLAAPLVEVAVLQEWATAHPDRAGLVYLADGGPAGVLGVVGDPEPVRAELRTAAAEPCVVQVEYSDDQMKKAQEAIAPLMDSISVLTTSYGGLRNRVEVSVTVADEATVRQLIAEVEDPRILSITGTSTILAGN